MGLEMIIGSTGLFAASTGIPQYFEQKKAARQASRAQEQANQVSRAQAQVENARRRRQAIAQARIAQASNIANQSQAVQSSSTLSGVQSSLGTQLGANLGAQQQRIGSQTQIQSLQQQSADALRKGQERVGAWNAAAQTAQTAFSLFGGGGSFMGGGQNMPNTANAWAQNTPAALAYNQ